MNSWYKLKMTKLTYPTIAKLMENFEKYEEILKTERKVFRNNFNFTNEIIDRIYASEKIELKEEQEKYIKEEIKIITLKDEIYPYLLKNIEKPPLFLYMKGKCEFSEKSIGIVGTRKLTDYGRSATEYIAKELAKSGVTIISGLASGVDGIAHKKALQHKADTIAVVGSGLDVIFPKENYSLWKRIEKEGTIISEYPLGTEPFKWNFPQRNRIIAGLSKGILVTESYKKGGSLITAKQALDENREVFAIPGFISYPSFEGCNNLIKNGEAKLVNCVEDILSEFSWDNVNENRVKETVDLKVDEEKIFKSLVVEKNLDKLILETGFDAGKLLVLITEMEIKGLIKSVAGGRYMRCNV